MSIVVGNALHRPIAEALVAAGKHVLCEKPLAGSMEDARAMVELERSADVVTAVGYTYRRSPAIAAIRDHVRNGELGELTLFNGRYWCDYACDPRGPLSWRFKGGLGSGALGDIGAHVIDVAEYLCGPIVSVSGGALSTQIPKRPLPLGAVVGHGAAPVSDEVGEVENEDTAMFTARFASGLAGVVLGVAHRVRHAQRPGLRRLRAGRAGLLRPAPAGRVPVRRRPARGPHPRRPAGDRRPADAVLPRRLPDGGPRRRHRQPGELHLPDPGLPGPDRRRARPAAANATFADALHTMEIIQAIVQSAQSDGAAVPVAPPPPATSAASAPTTPAPPPDPPLRSEGHLRWLSSSAPTPPACTTAPSPRPWTCSSPTA